MVESGIGPPYLLSNLAIEVHEYDFLLVAKLRTSISHIGSNL